mgnify:FL=1
MVTRLHALITTFVGKSKHKISNKKEFSELFNTISRQFLPKERNLPHDIFLELNLRRGAFIASSYSLINPSKQLIYINRYA